MVRAPPRRRAHALWGAVLQVRRDAHLIRAPGKPGTGRGGAGCWFLVDSVDRAYKELQANVFTFNEPPFDIPPGRLVTLLDPDGNIVGLIDNSKGGMPGQHA